MPSSAIYIGDKINNGDKLNVGTYWQWNWECKAPRQSVFMVTLTRQKLAHKPWSTSKRFLFLHPQPVQALPPVTFQHNV